MLRCDDAGSNRKMEMIDFRGRFVWYELLTTDRAAARVFYGNVLGWETQNASTPDVAYNMFTIGPTPLGGLMELPMEARQKGALPRWVGYVGVDDVDAVAESIRRLGGAVYVPPTNSNIGRLSVVADPQTATLALVTGLDVGGPDRQRPGELNQPGHVGWHELLAADWKQAFAFYNAVFGWRKVNAEGGSTDNYQLFSAGEQTIGGMFTKRPQEPVPFWLYYFNVDDVDAAAARVTAGGGQVFEGPYELPDGSWIARCRDPQGTAFAIQGNRSEGAIDRTPASSELGWSSAWGGISSRGRVLVNKTDGKGRKADSKK
jgi:uncharacterized protein